ncbi:MAG: glutamyl-tRNA reductase [Halobacteriaceae archaeon]
MAVSDVVTGAVVDQSEASLATVEAASRAAPAVADLHATDGVDEAVVLETCHRVECYVVTDTPAAGRAALAEFSLPGARVLDHEESLRHLLRVAAGLESMVLGEDQVLGQVRSAYDDARTAGAIGDVLEDAVTKAIHVGERARTETDINEGVVSLGSAAVRLAERHADLTDATALVVGAGEMGELAATAFATAVDHVAVANRTPSRAEAVAADLANATGVDLSALDEHLAAADVAVAATGSEQPVVGERAARAAGETVVVDLGNPRDVAPSAAAVEGFRVFDYADLEAVTERTHERRRTAADHVEDIVDAEFRRLQEGFKRKRADEVIAAMYESADELKRREVATALSQLEAGGDLTEDQREAVEALADSLVSQLLAAPTRSLRDAAAEDDWTTISTALSLFDPDFSLEDVPVQSLAGQPGDDATADEPDDGEADATHADDAVVVPEEYPDEVGAGVDADD